MFDGLNAQTTLIMIIYVQIALQVSFGVMISLVHDLDNYWTSPSH